MERHCPYCSAIQRTNDGEQLYRCHDCNFFVNEALLVVDPMDHVLSDTRRDFCPWCGFPVRQRQEPPGDAEFPCGGCGGTLHVEMLCTQREVAEGRQRSMKGAPYFFFFLLGALITIVLVYGFIL